MKILSEKLQNLKAGLEKAVKDEEEGYMNYHFTLHDACLDAGLPKEKCRVLKSIAHAESNHMRTVKGLISEVEIMMKKPPGGI